MPTVSPGYSFTSGSDPITYSKLNLLAQPTVSFGANETIPGFTLSAGTKAVLSGSVETWTSTLSLTISASYGNTRTISCSSNTACSITPSNGGTLGEPLWLVFATDGTGGNVITYASPFKSIGTHTLTGASKKFTSHFISDGTNWNEVARTAALS